MNETQTSQVEKVHGILKKFRTAMLITHTGVEKLHARPMAIAHVEPSCRLWFFSHKSTAKIHEIATDTHAHIVCQDDRDSYVSLSARATLTEDRAKVEEYWNETFKVWFPAGKDDPELVLISVTPTEGEYWDNAGVSKIKYLFEAAKAYVTGTTPKIEEGDQHGFVKL